MNRLFTLCIALCMMQISLSQERNQVTKDERGREKMLGTITKEGFTKNSFNTWFTPNYEAYEPDEKTIKKLKRKLKKYTITIFMGTWCGDSKREVPKFYKVLEAANFPESKLRVVGLNNVRSKYKQGPNGEEKGLNIHRVPTFIVYDKKGKEVGRIVENYDVLLYVANWPKPRVNAWDALLKARAIENMSYCIGVNRVGLDANSHEYSGHSAAYDVLGEKLTDIQPNKEETAIVILTKNNIETYRNKLKFLDDKDVFTLS